AAARAAASFQASWSCGAAMLGPTPLSSPRPSGPSDPWEVGRCWLTECSPCVLDRLPQPAIHTGGRRGRSRSFSRGVRWTPVPTDGLPWSAWHPASLDQRQLAPGAALHGPPGANLAGERAVPGCIGEQQWKGAVELPAELAGALLGQRGAALVREREHLALL